MPTPVITPHLLRSIRANRQLPPATWYIISGVALSILNRPEELPLVLRHAIEACSQNPEQRQAELLVARRMREALIKSSAIGGLPKVAYEAKSQSPADALGHQCFAVTQE